MSSYEFVGYQASDGIATATLRRPEKLKAFHAGMLGELREILAEVAGADEVRVLILTGAGRAFAVGADSAWFDVEAFAISGSPPRTPGSASPRCMRGSSRARAAAPAWCASSGAPGPRSWPSRAS